MGLDLKGVVAEVVLFSRIFLTWQVFEFISEEEMKGAHHPSRKPEPIQTLL